MLVKKANNYIPLEKLSLNINENFNRLITLTTKIALQDINIEYVITLNNKIILGKELQQVDYDEDITEQRRNQRAIFDLQKHNELKYEGFTLSPDKIVDKKKFDFTNLTKYFKRKKQEYLVIADREHVIDITQVQGNTRVPLITQEVLNEEITKINNTLKNKPITFRFVELAAIEIIIKACFKEGIDTPLELELADDRIIVIFWTN